MSYIIEDTGNILGKRGNYLKPYPNNEGYMRVRLYQNGVSKQKFVHRLVAEKFIPNPKGLPEVNHIDGNKANNQVSNLEWVTSSDNKLHALATGLRTYCGGPKGYKQGKAKSKYHNVTYRSNRGKWYASVSFKGKTYSRAGDSEEHAALLVNTLYTELGITDRPFNVPEIPQGD